MSDFDPASFVERLGDRRLSKLAAESDPLYVTHGCRWLREGRISLVTGREGSGKTTLARQIAAAVTVGNHWLAAESWTADPCVEPGQVCWISGDEPPARVAREFQRFSAEYGDYAPDGIHAYGVDDVRGPDALQAILTAIRPGAAGGGSADDARQAGEGRLPHRLRRYPPVAAVHVAASAAAHRGAGRRLDRGRARGRVGR